MNRRTVRDIDLAGQRILIRVDFNVPLNQDGAIADDRRIRAALPTLEHCLERDGALVLATHLGRPQGETDPALSTAPLARRLGELLDSTVDHVGDLIGEPARQRAQALQAGQVLMLENLRFNRGEKDDDEAFARGLRALGDAYVNDAFAVCHRQHASVSALPRLFPEHARCIGLLVEREIRALDGVLESPRQPLLAILGGAKVSDKLDMVEALLERADRLLIGGAMAYTFLQAAGAAVGESVVERDQLELARRLLERHGEQMILPQDHVVGRNGETKVVESIPEGWCGMDIGPKTIEQYVAAVGDAATVLWNGPMGKFEDEAFRRGTDAIIEAMADSDAVTVIGGGESAAAVQQLGLGDRIQHVSTGGGAFLEYLRAGDLPALSVIPTRLGQESTQASKPGAPAG